MCTFTQISVSIIITGSIVYAGVYIICSKRLWSRLMYQPINYWDRLKRTKVASIVRYRCQINKKRMIKKNPVYNEKTHGNTLIETTRFCTYACLWASFASSWLSFPSNMLITVLASSSLNAPQQRRLHVQYPVQYPSKFRRTRLQRSPNGKKQFNVALA